MTNQPRVGPLGSAVTIDRIYTAREVFTPTTPAEATFVERAGVNDKLVSALDTPGKQVVVYGHSGSGKTTLLTNKLHQLYERHITTHCTVSLSFDALLLNAFDQLDSFYRSEFVATEKRQRSSSLQAEYAGIKAQIGSHVDHDNQTKLQRFLPPQLTPQMLARLLGESKCCWVLDDFHKITEPEKIKLAQVMKVFMDMAAEYPSVKIVALGAVDTARQVVECDAEMRNRVAEIYVPLMSGAEIRQIIEKGEHLLNFEMPTRVQTAIVDYSSGLAYVCHQFGLNICDSSGITETLSSVKLISDQELQNAAKMYMDNASDTLKAAFEKAFGKGKVRKYDNARLILQALQYFDQDGATLSDMLRQIRSEQAAYPASNLTAYVKQLTSELRGCILRYDPISTKYSFSDPIYRTFATSLFAKHGDSSVATKAWAATIQSLSITDALAEILTLTDQILVSAKMR